MAKEIFLMGADPAGTYDVVIFLASNPTQVYNGSGFVTYTSANYATYARPLTQVGATGNFYADFPSTLAPDIYILDYRQRTVSGTAAESDSNAGGEVFEWRGSAYGRARLSNVLYVLPIASAGSLGGLPLVDDEGQVAAKVTAYDTGLQPEGFLDEPMVELSAVPTATATFRDALTWLFTLGRNKRTQSGTTETVYKDNGTTPIGTSTKSDNGVLFTRGEYQ